MKGSLKLAAGAALIGLLLCGCQPDAEPESLPALPSNSGPSSAAEQESQTEVSVDEEALMTALDGMLAYEPGTAGSSLKIAATAAVLLNFSETYSGEQSDAVANIIQAWIDGLESGQLDSLAVNLPAIYGTAVRIIEGGGDIKALLADAGDPQTYDSYDTDKFAAVKAIIDERLAQAARGEASSSAL